MHGPPKNRSPGALAGALGARKIGPGQDTRSKNNHQSRCAQGPQQIGRLLPTIVDGIARRAIAFHLANGDYWQANRIRLMAGLAWDNLLGLTERAA